MMVEQPMCSEKYSMAYLLQDVSPHTTSVWEYVLQHGAFPPELFSRQDDASPTDDESDDHHSIKKACSSDYSSLDGVRTGRWSKEEEEYANAMIEAFKTGVLPLPGTMSMRKFVSELLRCHPMRVSKKFVGYVRKYHWYTTHLAESTDGVAPHIVLAMYAQLSRLEQAFWSSEPLHAS
ncbi:hypothetical protein SPRG_01879 [Saprolegnia parasitica CBS 223.65]|uniref:Uncharacterized protein n=1 Tax=Saprolegnia parasitica (strain CBS 223.65) TaxID=695850 RepID=A0A067CQT7_SAPPC|nr:hypothetical protein SPRG_01879 [Saprolegnia parasitica CBS 223.65]KDO33064.1 hypothetical protein SPRG_01879 [Saprolegnia parasitica CBS 223.65]|eukprot:XP_012195835.1 hypothetical protein SPRG_01879 [Saprolegnia parasitica CBS 223.65]